MAEEEAAADASAAEEPKKKGGKKKLIIIIVVVLVVGIAGYWFFLKPSGSPSAAVCPPTTLPGWKPASAKQLAAAKAVTKTAPPGAKTTETTKAPEGAAAEGKTEGAKAEGAAKEKCEPPEPPVPGPVVKMEPMTLSLADGSYLKVGLGLQLAEGADPKLWTEDNRGLRAQDVAVRVLRSRTSAQLAPGKPLNDAQSELSKEVAVAFASDDGTTSEVIGVLFTEFVMQ